MCADPLEDRRRTDHASDLRVAEYIRLACRGRRGSTGTYAAPVRTLCQSWWFTGAVPSNARRSRSTPNSDLTTAQVIAQFNAAYASGNANLIGQTKNQFAFLNEQGCPLN